MKEIKDYINRWRDIPYFWVGRINIVKMTIWLNAIYRFNAIPIKLTIFFRLGQKISKLVWEHKRPRTAKAISNKKNGVGAIRLSHFSLCYKTSNQNKDTSTKRDMWNRVEGPEINPRTYGQWIYNKEGKNIQWNKDALFNEWCWETGQLYVKEWIRTFCNTIYRSQLKMD